MHLLPALFFFMVGFIAGQLYADLHWLALFSVP